MRAIGKTDVGKLRTNNEDTFFVSQDPVGSLPDLFIVADGMGGHKAGEVASQSALTFFLEYVGANPCPDGELLDYLTEAAAYANANVYARSLTDSAYSGMGTTFSACVVSGGKAYIVHIGDSRIYKCGGGSFTQLTNDHTYVGEMMRAGQFSKEEAARHPNKNALTRALGVEKNVLADGRIDRLEAGDRLLMCSDGLSNMVPEEEITEIMISETDIAAKVDSLIERAKAHGGADNITAIIVEA